MTFKFYLFILLEKKNNFFKVYYFIFMKKIDFKTNIYKNYLFFIKFKISDFPIPQIL